MRVLALRGENLASLTGPFEVDFQAPPLADVGLFAVTGPTGAGKSTLLDALCLALFDAVPRLANSSSALVGAEEEPEDRRLPANDVRSVLTRGAGRGFAEVDFVGNDGRRYRARWEVRRARERADGRYQAQTLSLYDLQESRPLGRTKGEVQALIVERLGLTFEQFRRAVLLAQGDFAAFLRAKERERSELLERLTGTELYGQVSRAAHERASVEAQALRELEARLAGTRPLPEGERTALEQQAAARRDTLDQAERALARARQAASWCEAQATLERGATAAEAALFAAAGAVAEAAPRRELLRRVEQAEPLRAAIERADRLCAEQETAAARLAEARTGEAQATAAVAGQEARVAGTAAEAEAADRAWQAARPEIEAARHLDARVVECGQRLAEARLAAEAAAAASARAAAVRVALVKRQAALTDGRDRELAWLSGEAALGPLAREWGRWDAEIARYAQRLAVAGAAESRVVELQAQRLRAQVERDDAARARALTAAALTGAEAALAAAEAACAGQDLAALQARERASLERLLVFTSRSAEALRAHLAPGEPCPVCGATDHPWAPGRPVAQRPGAPAGAPVPGTLAGHRGALEADLEALRAALTAAIDARDRRDAAVREAAAARQADDSARDRVAAVETRLRALDGDLGLEAETARSARTDLDAIRQVLGAPFEPFPNWASELAADPSGFRARFAARVEAWLGHERSRASGDEDLAALAPRLAEAEATARAAAEGERQAVAAAQALEGECRARQAERGALLGGRAAGEVEAGLQTRRDAAAAAEREARAALAQAGNALAGARASAAHWEAELARRAGECEAARQARDGGLAAQALELEAARGLLAREPAWVGRERASLDGLDRAARDARVLAEERQRQAAEHGAARPPGLDCAGVGEALAAAQAAHAEAQGAWAAAHGRLQEDERRRQDAAALEAEAATRAAGARLWEELRELIGSADGNKFRTFAQSLTLDALLAHANRHLEDLARRYRLERSPGSELALQVVDADMGDEVRSVYSLSGGESFLVSLALALGLASLASHRTRVESLFIDEGFGSLDPETLDTAIASLDALQALGRKVGVISHVPTLVERIGVQVRVEPRGGGRSRVRTIASEPEPAAPAGA